MSYTPNRMTLKDGSQLDAFSRLRVSMGNTQFDSQQEYGLDTRTTWDATANGTLSTPSSNGSVTNGSNLVGPTNANTRLTPLTVSTTSGHYAVLQSKQYIRYIPGKSQLVLMTGIFSPGTIANCDARIGYFDSANGVFLKVTNGVASFVLRTSTSGSVSDAKAVISSAWSVDHFDGTGPSGITLDLTKTQILVIDAQWLGVGRVRCGFDIDGVIYIAHEFKNANALLVPYTQTFNLPVRMEIRNTGTSTGTPTIQFVCCSVQSEGGQEQRGFPWSAPVSITTTAVTTRRPVLSVRPKATYNSRTNRGHIEGIEFFLRTTTNDSLFEIVVGGTLTGAAWTSVDTDSMAEYDTTATAITGGSSGIKGWSLSGSGSIAVSSMTSADLRNPLVLSQIDALTATQTNISLVCTSVTGTSNVSPAANWHEQLI